MSAAGRGAVLDVAEAAAAPVFAGDAVGLSAVLQELAGESPVSVALQPRSQPVRVARLAQATDIRIRDLVGNEAPEVPEEPVCIVTAARAHAEQGGEVGRRVVTEGCLELGGEVIGVVLPALLVAVEDRVLNRLAVFRRRAGENLSEVGVEVRGDVFAAHLIDLVARCLGVGGTVLRARRRGTEAVDHPLADRHLPVKRAVRRDLVRQHHGLRRIERRAGHVRGIVRPLVLVPHRERRLVHLRERLLVGARDKRRAADRDGREPRLVPRASRHGHAEPLRRAGRERRDDGRMRGEPHAHPVVHAAKRHVAERPPRAAVVPSLDLHTSRSGAVNEGQLGGLRRKRRLGFKLNDERFALALKQGIVDVLRFQSIREPGRCRVCDRAHVAHVRRWRVLELRRRQFHAGCRTVYHRHARDETAHGRLGLHPRSAGLAPAGRVEDADLDVKPARRLERRSERLFPFGGESLHGAGLVSAPADVADVRAVDAGAFHRLEVLAHAFARDVAGHPVPVTSSPDLAERIREVVRHLRVCGIGGLLAGRLRHLVGERPRLRHGNRRAEHKCH